MDSSDSFTNFELRIYSFFSEYLLLFNWQTEKKKCLGPSNSYGSSFFFQETEFVNLCIRRKCKYLNVNSNNKNFRELYNSGFVDSGFVLLSDTLAIKTYKPGNFFVRFRIRTVLPLR